MNERGALIVVSAPSGTGKSTVLHALMEKRNTLRFSVSATTRSPRAGETEGVDYFFVTKERFQEMVRRDAFLEYAEYVGNCYGTPREPVDALRDQGYDVYLDIDVQGAMQVRQRCADALLIFLAPPSFEELERRLVARGTDGPDVIQKRLREAEREYAQRGQFEYLVINDEVPRAVEEISGIIDAHRARMRAVSVPSGVNVPLPPIAEPLSRNLE